MIVVVSILNWNSITKTIACLESLQKLNYPNLTVCVTDNGSLNFNDKELRGVYNDLIIFKNDENLGFAAGQLQALGYAKNIGATLFWMLNNDTEVFPDTLIHLLDAYQTNGNGVYGSASVSTDLNLTTELIWQLDENTFNTRFEAVSKERLSQNHTLRVANVVGYSLIIPISLIEKHGFMDTSYFLYYEETDYCLRLLKKRVPSYWVGSSRVYHEKEGSTSGNPLLKEVMEYYLYRNLFILLKRHGAFRMVLYYLRRFSMRFLSANVARKRKVPALTKKHLMGIFHAFVGKSGKYYAPENYLSE